MRRWSKNVVLQYIRYSTPAMKLIDLSLFLAVLAIIVFIVKINFSHLYSLLGVSAINNTVLDSLLILALSIVFFIMGIVECINRSNTRQIKYLVRNRLCKLSYGNPLNLQEGEISPNIVVTETKNGYKVTTICSSAKFGDVSRLESVISDCLIKEYKNYAVVAKDEDIAGRHVDYYIEDVVSNAEKQSVYSSISEIPTDEVYKFHIRDDICIDYSKVMNSSLIVAGRTRSGKTTGIISTFLLPALINGRDDFGSTILIVDPKSAELSNCPYVLSPKLNGDVNHILNAISQFNKSRIERQQIINNTGLSQGKAIRWWEIGMKPSFLFIDEFVSLQGLFPKKTSRDNQEYSHTEFQNLIRQIATQGASAGCFLIISTAEASVGTGGLESVVNNACGIRILFKPSKEEAGYLWNSEKLDVLRERIFVAGDAWFSADDGDNDNVSFVKFPKLEFGEYKALSSLLELYFD